MKYNYSIDNVIYEVEIMPQEEGYAVKIGEDNFQVSGVQIADGEIKFVLDGSQRKAAWAAESARKTWISLDGKTHVVEKPSAARRRQMADGAGESTLLSPMPGQVREVLAAVGDEVEQGQTLVLLEAMKMEIRIKAPRAGVVKTMSVEAGGQVDKGDILVELE